MSELEELVKKQDEAVKALDEYLNSRRRAWKLAPHIYLMYTVSANNFTQLRFVNGKYGSHSMHANDIAHLPLAQLKRLADIVESIEKGDPLASDDGAEKVVF